MPSFLRSHPCPPPLLERAVQPWVPRAGSGSPLLCFSSLHSSLSSSWRRFRGKNRQGEKSMSWKLASKSRVAKSEAWPPSFREKKRRGPSRGRRSWWKCERQGQSSRQKKKQGQRLCLREKSSKVA